MITVQHPYSNLKKLKPILRFISSILLMIVVFSFTAKNDIGPCYISFKSATNLSVEEPDRLPESSDNVRILKTDSGEVEITRTDGYRMLYYNANKAPFVNLKVELSENTAYESDQKKLLSNLRYLNSHAQHMETKDLIELQFNGYKVYGLSRASVEAGSTLGTFVMFPGNGVTVYFYFNNMKPEYRHFETVDDYKKQRDTFMEEYTKHLKTCKNN